MKRTRDHAVSLLIALCALAIIACGGYLFYNYVHLPRKIQAQNAQYAALYTPSTPAPTEKPTEIPTKEPTEEPTQLPTPVPTSEPTTEPTLEPAPEPTPTPDGLTDIPFGTPGPDTIIYSAPTMPPVQESFADLLAFNPETVGFLMLGDISLPVVQRLNDNTFYLEHDFEGSESKAGSLFLDCVNRLYPADKVLYVYGHNMKNGAMFGNLTDFSRLSVLKENPIVRFNTIYRDGDYVPFACFDLSANENSSSYFQLRNFSFTDESLDEYIAELKRRSTLSIPVDAIHSDEILVLVTCNYSINDGRFVLACRRLRENETEITVRALIGQTTAK